MDIFPSELLLFISEINLINPLSANPEKWSNTLKQIVGNLPTICLSVFKKKKKNFMAPFYGWGSTASRLEPLRGGSLLFTTKFPEVPGTHSIDLGRMKG